MIIFLGIDPGASGGIAAYVEGEYAAAKMPETEYDIWEAMWFDGPRFAVIEHVHSMPKQGVASSFKFGRSYGFLRGCLVASGTPFEEVTPQRWQKALGCLSRGNKNVTKARAQQLFPGLKITHATADALLLAEYARRLWLSRNGHAPPPPLAALPGDHGSQAQPGAPAGPSGLAQRPARHPG